MDDNRRVVMPDDAELIDFLGTECITCGSITTRPWAVVLDPGPPSPGKTGGLHIMIHYVETMSLGPYCSPCAGKQLNDLEFSRRRRQIDPLANDRCKHGYAPDSSGLRGCPSCHA